MNMDQWKFRLVNRKTGVLYGPEKISVQEDPQKESLILYTLFFGVCSFTDLETQIYSQLTDCKNKELYVGDIVSCRPPFKTWAKVIEKPVILEVDYLHGEFILRNFLATAHNYFCSLSKGIELNNLEVIGHKYEPGVDWRYRYFEFFEKNEFFD